MTSKRASKGELLLNEIDAIIERTNNSRAAASTKNCIPNDAETTTTVILEDMTKKPRFNASPPVVSLPDSGAEKSNSIKERAKSFQGSSIPPIPSSPTLSSSATTEKTVNKGGSNSNSSIPANAQHLDTTLEGKVPTHRKSSFVADAIAAVQNKNMSVNPPEQPAPQAGITKAKAWPNVGSGMLRSSCEMAKSTETAALRVSRTTLATDDIPTVDEPQIESNPVPLSVTVSASTAGSSSQVPTTARNKLAAFLAASSQKDVFLQQVLSQGSASINSKNNEEKNEKVAEAKTQNPEPEKKDIASEETVTNKPHRKPSVVMNAMAQLQSKGE